MTSSLEGLANSGHSVGAEWTPNYERVPTCGETRAACRVAIDQHVGGQASEGARRSALLARVSTHVFSGALPAWLTTGRAAPSRGLATSARSHEKRSKLCPGFVGHLLWDRRVAPGHVER